MFMSNALNVTVNTEGLGEMAKENMGLRHRASLSLKVILFLPFLLVGVPDSLPAAASLPDLHRLEVSLRLDEKSLAVLGEIRLASHPGDQLTIHLAPRTKIGSVSVDGSVVPFSFDAGRLTVSLPRDSASAPPAVKLSYEAVFDDPVPDDPVSFDNPGFGVTGTITPQGVFLLPGSGWHPRIAGRPASVHLEVSAPSGIYAVSAGRLGGHEDRRNRSISVWDIEPMVEGLALSAGPYVIESRRTGKVPVYTYLFPQSAHLSERYLRAAASHLEFFEALHGPYAFPKFAVVENFFPTGYGFPSCTLLGTTVLRLPFIPDTSLKHEVAHSWWGNGVLVAHDSGNWCEGLTTYVSDYLGEERSSTEDGLQVRRKMLQEYAALAATGEDFPLSGFLGRTSPSTRAVGYGKAAFIFHMIRQRIGDDRFWRSLQHIYRDRLFQDTSWEDFRQVFTDIGGWDAAESRRFFDQWIPQAGAPRLEIQDARQLQVDEGWLVEGLLVQSGNPYALRVPLQLETEGGIERQVISTDGPSKAFSFRSPHRPERLVGDPEAHIFRRLAPEEIPASVNSIKGSRNLTAVLAKSVDSGFESIFRILLESLNQGDVSIIREDRLNPADVEGRDVIYFGRPGPDALQWLLPSRPNGIQLSAEGFSYDGKSTDESGDCLFAVFKDPGRKGGLTAVFHPVEETPVDSVNLAARKITHYGRYSAVSFADGINCGKTVWPVTDSPLIISFKESP